MVSDEAARFRTKRNMITEVSMPFYKCITLAGTFAQAQKEEIVGEITRIHCEATGGLQFGARAHGWGAPFVA
jgi:hypothetical protein